MKVNSSTNNYAVYNNKTINVVMLIVLLFALSVSYISIYLFMLILLGLMPTIMVTIIDLYPEKYMAKAVGSFNFLGLIPYLTDSLFIPGNIDDNASRMLSYTGTWLQVYGVTLIGWLLYILLPLIFQLKGRYYSRYKLHKYNERIEELKFEWGLHPKE